MQKADLQRITATAQAKINREKAEEARKRRDADYEIGHDRAAADIAMIEEGLLESAMAGESKHFTQYYPTFNRDQQTAYFESLKNCFSDLQVEEEAEADGSFLGVTISWA